MDSDNYKRYESALNLLFYEGQIGWQMNIVFLAINGGLIALCVACITNLDNIWLNILGIILCTGGVVISFKWLHTFNRNSKYYHFRMAQAREAEPHEWSLVGDRGFRFSKGEIIEINGGVPESIKYAGDKKHWLTTQEEKAKNKSAMELVIICSIVLYFSIMLILGGYMIHGLNICLSIEWTSLLSGLIPSIVTVVITSLILLWAYNKQFKLFEQQINDQRSQINEQRRQIDSQLTIDRNQNSMNMLLKFDEEFNGAKLTSIRKEIGKKIIENPDMLKKDSIDYRNEVSGDLEYIYDFYDTISHFIRREYIFSEDAWHFFDSWFSHYYDFYKRYKIKLKSNYPETVWNNLEYLKESFDKLENEKTPKIERLESTVEDFLSFFKDESEL